MKLFQIENFFLNTKKGGQGEWSRISPGREEQEKVVREEIPGENRDVDPHGVSR